MSRTFCFPYFINVYPPTSLNTCIKKLAYQVPTYVPKRVPHEQCREVWEPSLRLFDQFLFGHFNLVFGTRSLLWTAFLCLKLCQMCCAGLRYESKVYIAFKHPMFVQPYQDCQDVVKEVPYLAPEERCEKVGLASSFQRWTLLAGRCPMRTVRR